MKPMPIGGPATGFNDILGDPTVQDAMGQAWRKCQINPAGKVHEEGGIIYFNPITGEIVVAPFTGPFAPKNPQPGTTAETMMTGVACPGYFIIGHFHTHPYNKYPISADLKNIGVTKIPSIIIWPDGKNCSTYGPPRRIGGLGPRPGPGWP